jgi:glycerophosphoryl diester phosphodiesterase
MKKLQRNNVYNRRFTVFGHRGVPSRLPENTIESFKKAVELKYDGFELDVLLTKDDVLIVRHDKEIKINSRLEKIINIKYADILKHSLHPPPKLEKVLDSLGHKTNINIEIKDQGAKASHISKKVIKELKKFNLIDNIVISSFSPWIIREIKNYDDRYTTAWIWGNKNLRFFNCWRIVLKYINPQAVHINYNLVNESIVRKTQSNNIKVLAYTVNQKKDLLKMIDKKVDGVFTDLPAILKTAKNEGL